MTDEETARELHDGSERDVAGPESAVGTIRRLNATCEALEKERDEAKAGLSAAVRAAMEAGRTLGKVGVELDQIDREAWKKALGELTADLVTAESRATRAEQERDEAKAERTRFGADSYVACRNLVAVLNGDGGHRQAEVGMAQAAQEAQARVAELGIQREQAYAERDEARLAVERERSARLALHTLLTSELAAVLEEYAQTRERAKEK